MRRVLVTGGTGLIGTALAGELIARGIRPLLLARHLPPGDERLTGADYLEGDVGLPEFGLPRASGQRLARGLDTIFHLAARVDFRGRKLADYQGVNIDGTRRVTALAAAAGASLHHVSTAFVCGRAPRFHEDDFDCGQGFRNAYEESKFLAEAQVRRFHDRHPGRATIYRPAIILDRQGRGGHAFGPFFFMEAILRLVIEQQDAAPLRLAGNPAASLPMLFADQTAAAIAAIASRGPAGRTYHLTPRRPLRNQVLEDLVNQAFGRRVVQWAAPADFAARPADRRERILARRTAAYGDYLDIDLAFGRAHTDAVLGKDALPCPAEEEFLRAFAAFLRHQRPAASVPDPAPDTDPVRGYFTKFLPGFMDQRLIDNLVSLNADFWIEIDHAHLWSLSVRAGRLVELEEAVRKGSFGYRTDAATYLRVVGAEISPQEGFFKGRIHLSGSHRDALRTAAALEEFFQSYPFRIPQPHH